SGREELDVLNAQTQDKPAHLGVGLAVAHDAEVDLFPRALQQMGRSDDVLDALEGMEGPVEKDGEGAVSAPPPWAEKLIVCPNPHASQCLGPGAEGAREISAVLERVNEHNIGHMHRNPIVEPGPHLVESL